MPLRELTVAVARIASDVTSLTELVEKSIRSGSPTQEATQARHYAQLLMLIEQPPMDVSVPATIRSMAELPTPSGLPDDMLEYRPTPPALAGMAKLVLDMTHRNLGLVLYASEILPIEQTDLYDGLVRLLKDRRTALSAIQERPEGIETASPEQIHGLADAYEGLVSETDEFRRQLAAFIVSLLQTSDLRSA
jgi:hypothetical protein